MTDTSFHEVVFPEDISYGSSGGAGWSTTVITLTSGFEQRNINWQNSRSSYEVTYGIKTRDQMEALQDFFYARRGKAYGFRYKDWADYTIEGGILATFNGTVQTIQINKRYEPETSHFVDRPIKKPVSGSLQGFFYFLDTRGNRTNLDPSTYSLDCTTGLFTYTVIPTAGTLLYVDYLEFHVPLRFDTDQMKITQDAWETMSWPSIELMELKLG